MLETLYRKDCAIVYMSSNSYEEETMKIQVRENIFETNSSSTHTLSMYMKKDWDAYEKGEKVINKYELTLHDSVEAGMKENKYSEEEDFLTAEEMEEYIEERGFESFEDKIQTPSGETVIAYGYYGWDG